MESAGDSRNRLRELLPGRNSSPSAGQPVGKGDHGGVDAPIAGAGSLDGQYEAEDNPGAHFSRREKIVAECLDLAVVTEGDTLDEVTANIREAIGLHLEGENLADLGIADDPTVVATMELDAVA